MWWGVVITCRCRLSGLVHLVSPVWHGGHGGGVSCQLRRLVCVCVKSRGALWSGLVCFCGGVAWRVRMRVAAGRCFC